MSKSVIDRFIERASTLSPPLSRSLAAAGSPIYIHLALPHGQVQRAFGRPALPSLS